MVTLSLRGYLKDTSTTLMRALPLDLTPSIGPGFGPHLDEGRQIALEAGQLEVRDLEDVVADVVQETGVVRHHDARHVRERLDVVLDPLDVHDVEVVRGLVHE